jgi:muramoyltetrapeptide carboxypeptidase
MNVEIIGDDRRPNVRIVSTGEPVLCMVPTRRARAESALEEHGYRVTYGAHAFDMSRDLRWAGSPSERASDLMEAFEDSDVDVVLVAEADVGSAEMLEFLDSRVFINNPKPFVGACDNGYINAFLATDCALISQYGYGFLRDFGEPGGPFRETLDYFESVVNPREFLICNQFTRRTNERVSLLNPKSERRIRSRNVAGGVDWIRHGAARGRLIGGEISILPDIVRSSGMDLAGGILFWHVASHGLPIEPLFEELCKIDAVRDIEAMLIGAHPTTSLQAWSDVVRGLIKKYLPETLFPVVANTYIGELAPKWLVPYSEECRLNEDGSLVFRHGIAKSRLRSASHSGR